ncbi:MAG: M23 family metallopeptidase [Minisyncoccia bacterium]
MRLIYIASLSLFFVASPVLAVSISVMPEVIEQGSPVLIRVHDVPAGSTVSRVTIGATSVPVFTYQSIPSALFGVPLTGTVGSRTITAQLSNGTAVTHELIINPLIKETRVNPPVPVKLGGNGVKNELRIVSVLEKENFAISNLFTQPKVLWKNGFVPPLLAPIVTDTFGYIRTGSASTITHKGTDYRAKEGTPIIAMNKGIVRLSKKFTVYGNTVIIDHGLGVQTLYMHLSKLKVAHGQLVEQGTVLGYSGKTGYAERPHLHLSVRINGASVDPQKFLSLFAK